MKSPLKWHGGKSYLADWIISNFPAKGSWSLYREPYFGGGSVLLRMDGEGVGEAVNDLDRDLSNFWKALRSPITFVDLCWRLNLTPFSEDMWEMAGEDDGPQCQDPCEVSAYWFFLHARQSRQGLRKDFATPTSRTRRGMAENVSAWLSAVEGLPDVHNRLKRVEIRCMDALEFIRKYDHPRALFYCDPPYLHSTRTATKAYAHEMSLEDHQELLGTLDSIEGKFVLSGYPSELYDEWAFRGQYRRVSREVDNKSSGKKEKDMKTECLWMNY